MFFVEGENAEWVLVMNAYFFNESYIIGAMGGEELVIFESATTKAEVYRDESECGK